MNNNAGAIVSPLTALMAQRTMQLISEDARSFCAANNQHIPYVAVRGELLGDHLAPWKTLTRHGFISFLRMLAPQPGPMQ